MTTKSAPRSKRKFARLLLVMAMFASAFVLDAATAEPADADWVCNTGWQLQPYSNTCTANVRTSVTGCNAGYVPYNGSQCMRTQRYCTSGYLVGNYCRVYFWGHWGWSTSSVRTIFQPMTTSYQYVPQTMPARWIQGTVSGMIGPACTTQMVGTFEKPGTRQFIDTYPASDFHVTEFVRTYTVWDQLNYTETCGNVQSKYNVSKHKRGRALCTAKNYGGQTTCGPVANWEYLGHEIREPGH